MLLLKTLEFLLEQQNCFEMNSHGKLKFKDVEASLGLPIQIRGLIHHLITNKTTCSF